MEKNDNLRQFIRNKKIKLSKQFKKLFLITKNKEKANKLKNCEIGKLKDKQYFFIYEGKKYFFSLFSDMEIQSIDKKYLKSSLRSKYATIRSLKLACSMDIVNSQIAIGKSNINSLGIIILYEEKGIKKVIDYAINIVMEKESYYELFQFEEYNVLSKLELFDIYNLLEKLNDFEHLNEYLLFSKEVFKDLSKIEFFSYLSKKYDENGMNRNNELIIGHNCDCLYFQKIDKWQLENETLVRELKKFTNNSIKNSKHIFYDKENEVYLLKHSSIGVVTFKLLSSFINNHEKMKERLEIGFCHSNVHVLIHMLSESERENAYIVAGRFKENEIDYFYHSWVEAILDGIDVVLDYNHNIIMKKEDYYRLFAVEVINKMSFYEMSESVNLVAYKAGFDFLPMDFNYFGDLFKKDLQRNENIF